MVNLRLIQRELTASPQQSIIFLLCSALSIITLVSLSGFSDSVDRSLLRDAKSLHAADIIIESNYEISAPLSKAVESLRQKGDINAAKVYEFYSVIRPTGMEGSLLADIKAVDPGYPFYGTVDLASGRPFREVLSNGGVIVERTLLDRLNMSVGDGIRIGSAVLVVRDVVAREPDRPVNFFSLGPRIFVAAQDLDRLDLIKKGSRVHYKTLIKVQEGLDVERIAAALRSSAIAGQERVESFRTAESRIRRFFDNLLFFLNLIGILTLLLAGIGIQSALTAFLAEREKTIAIMKAVGATKTFITLNFSAIVALLGLFGAFAGIIGSLLLQGVLPLLFGGILPGNVEFAVSWFSVVQGIILGMTVVALFTYLPLSRLEDVRPASIIGKEETGPGKGRAFYLSIAATVIFSAVMAAWRVRDIKTAAYFVSGIIALISLSFLATELVIFALKRVCPPSLSARQALRGLLRPGNATRAIIVTLTASLTVITSIYLVERNLDADFVDSYPEDAPNLFFLDIQPSQKEEFTSVLGMKAEYYPVIRARISSINGEPINLREEERKMGDNLAREFNLTYRDYLLPDELLLKGKSLFRPDWKGVHVSVLDTVLKMKDMKIGDRITFNIQGVPLEAAISSIRTRTRASIQPFFYFVFPESVLKDAPQTIFTAVRVGSGEISPLQNRIAARFPNVSFIDMTGVVSLFSKVMGRLSAITRFFTLFSITAGVLIIISSALATRYARIREAVYFKILGAKRSFVLKVLTLENLFLGLISATLALAFSQAISWIVCRMVMDVRYRLFIGPSLLMILATVLLVTVTGILASAQVLRHRPAVFLREETRE